MNLTRESIGDALDVYAKHHGSTVYEMPGSECKYVEWDFDTCTLVGGCLYGHVMTDLGMSLETLADNWEGKEINAILKSYGVDDARLINAALCSQRVQDTCELSWAHAVQTFHAILELGTRDIDANAIYGND